MIRKPHPDAEFASVQTLPHSFYPATYLSAATCILNNLPTEGPQLVYPEAFDVTNFEAKIKAYPHTEQHLKEWQDLADSFDQGDQEPIPAPEKYWCLGLMREVNYDVDHFRPHESYAFSKGIPLKLKPPLNLEVGGTVAMYPPENCTDLFWLAKVIDLNTPFLKVQWWQVEAPYTYASVKAKYYLINEEATEQNLSMVIQKVRLTKKKSSS